MRLPGSEILSIVVIVIFALFVIDGWRKGLFKKVTGVLAFILSCVLVPFVLPYVTDYLKDNTPVYSAIAAQCEKTVTDQVASFMQKGTENEVQNGGASGALGSLSQIDQTKLIRSLPLPSFLQNMMLSYNNREGYRSLNVTDFGGYLVQFVANVILNILAFIVTLLLVFVVIWVILKIAGVASHLPFIHLLDRVGGMILGGVQGVIVIWFFFLIISMLTGTKIGLSISELINESKILRPVYQGNALMKIVTDALHNMM